MASAITAIVGIVAGGGGAGGLLGGLFGGLLSMVKGFVLSALQKALQKTPEDTSTLTDRSQMFRQAITTRNIIYGRVKTSGPLAYAETYKVYEDANEFLDLIVIMATHEISSFEDVYFGDDEITYSSSGAVSTSEYSSQAWVYKKYGTDSQSALSKFVSHDSSFTSSHKLSGIAYLGVTLKYHSEVFPDGIPNVSAVIKGKTLYDPRTGTTYYSANPALALRDYLTNTRYGMSIPSSEIDNDSIKEAANVCDENVSTTSGTEDRYTVNGILDTTNSFEYNINQILGAMAGKLVYENGMFRLLAGEYRTPTLTLTSDDVTGTISVNALTSKSEIFNAVRGVYICEDNEWESSDFPIVSNSTYQTSDGGERLYNDIELPLTSSSATCQRIAKIYLEQARQELVVTMTCKLKAFSLSVGDTVKVTNEILGWEEKIFEVLEWQLVVSMEGDASSNGTINVMLTLQETDSSVYDWNSGEETVVDPAPNTNLPTVFNVDTLTNLAADSGQEYILQMSSGDLIPRIYFTWTSSTDAFVTKGGSLEVWLKKTSSGTWEKVSELDGSATEIYLSNVEDGIYYDLGVKAVNTAGVKSSLATLLSHYVIGKTEPPTNVSNFLVTTNLNNVIFTWDKNTDIDLEGYEIRYSSDTTASWKDATPLTSAEKGTLTSTVAVPPGPWLFYIKAIDTSGNYSNQASVYGPVTMSNSQTVLQEIADGAFPGTVDNFVRHYTEVLVPTSTKLANEYNDFEVFDNYVPDPEQLCTYTTTELDLLSDEDVRIWGDILSYLGPGVEDGNANPKLQIKYRLDGEASDEVKAESDITEQGGTFTACALDYRGNLYPTSQSLANETDWDVFDNFVYNPYTQSIFEADVIDLGSDINTTLSNTLAEYKGQSTDIAYNTTIYSDYKTSISDYNGYTVFTNGIYNLQYLKIKIIMNNTNSYQSYIKYLNILLDSWRNWQIGELTARYIQARIKLDTDVGLAKITDFNWTLDQ